MRKSSFRTNEQNSVFQEGGDKILMKIVLGSKSKWRRSIAEESLGMEVLMAEADVDEKAVARAANPKTPQDHVKAIASAKLDKVLKDLENSDDDTIVLCYDTVVVYDNQILEKPKDETDLERMVKLWAKKGTTTFVYTAVAIGKRTKKDNKQERLETVCKAAILLTDEMTEERFNHYIQDQYVRQSSGAYIVENLQEMGIAEITEGTIDIIQGLPIETTKEYVNQLLK